MHDIFVSYSRRDTDMMQRVVATLRESGLIVWTDEGIQPGTQSWRDAIGAAILECQYVIVLFSPDSAQSTWVSRELDYAELHNKRIYPLLVGGDVASAIPFGYTTYQFVDIRSDEAYKAGMGALVASLSDDGSAVSKTPSQPVIAPTSTPQIQTWQWVNRHRAALTVPSDWSVYDPTPENIQRLQILMMGNDETLFYRAVEDFNSNFINQALGIPLGTMQSICTMSSISGLSPLVGFLAEYRGFIPTPAFLIPPVMSLFKPRIKRFMRSRYRSAVSDFRWQRVADGRMWSYQWELPAIQADTQGMIARAYTIMPGFARRKLFLTLICETSRFENEVETLEQIARSLTFIYK